MDSLNDSNWDVLISGTGIQQSLLALALSRSGKKILHVDKDDTYGGPEAALSLQEAEKWVEKLSAEKRPCSIHNASVSKPSDGEAKLSPSRAYNLSLGPTLVYTRSGLLPILVSSKVHQQLEFMAVGSWFVYERHEGNGRLARVPNGREDIFADQSLKLRTKGQLMKFLRFVASYEETPETWHPHRDMPFLEFLSQQFGLPAVDPLMSLCLSPEVPEKTSTEFALPRIARHLRSIGVFGPGFGAVIPKWGGLSEIAQVSCRACAVGGGVYVLGQGISTIEPAQSESEDDVEEIPRAPPQDDIAQDIQDQITSGSGFVATDEGSLDDLETSIRDQSLDDLLAAAGYSVADSDEATTSAEQPPVETQNQAPKKSSSDKPLFSVQLSGGDRVTTHHIIGCSDDLPDSPVPTTVGSHSSSTAVSRNISVISSSMQTLFVAVAEGGVAPAGAVVVFPSGSLSIPGAPETIPPVNIMVHSSDTGECPQGQCVAYASTILAGDEGRALLEEAVKSLVTAHDDSAQVLWSLRYEQISGSSSASPESGQPQDNILRFPDAPLDVVFDDVIIENVQAVWQKIMGDDADDFMVFRERGAADEDEAEAEAEDEDDVEDA